MNQSAEISENHRPPDCHCATCKKNPNEPRLFCSWCGLCYFYLCGDAMFEYDVGSTLYDGERGSERWFCSACVVLFLNTRIVF